ncbi:TIGR01620 family protein [Microbulbifer thermotolerans]|uniref:TIGR01620 family protein n=1 Tax=Microbulbifer thermotolerans TaxID=252514 RepID=UPI0008F02D21|nr:TIGR01620 family protein [Microbulbifer thermotolerans]MCX2779604.1 TIGR01620 family protein [Microbulbifer thermotolerans]MCX2804965.1 TIGR01620 family protein [Microbulbifer thermotolerans]MCX2833922.1 TIGR01620 family protein [Microbulbifer thermotolerans]MCX2841946.1 TIGR01620 family protein [Microbulbifer thermotolerans]SFB92778.1 putative membrane protein [Microbulbifer thermotolerans]
MSGEQKPKLRQTRIEPLEEVESVSRHRDSTRVETLGEGGEELPRSITTGESLPDKTSFSELRLPRYRLRFWKPALVAALGLAIGAVVWELRDLYNWAADKHWSLGLLAGTVIASFCLVIVSAVWEYFSAGRPLRELHKTRELAAQLRDCRSYEETLPFRRQLRDHFAGKPQGVLLSRVLEEAPDYYDSSELLQHLEVTFLEALDQEALRRIVRHGTTTGALVGLSPFASLDILVALRQSLRMIDDVAQIYGVRPSLVVRWRLFKQVLALVAYSGASEYAVSELWPELVGDSVLNTLSARLGQGMGASLFMARIGLAAMQSCRPIPFADKCRPRLGTLAKRIAASLSERVLRGKGDGRTGVESGDTQQAPAGR